MRLIISFLLNLSVLFALHAQVSPTVSISDHNGNTQNITIDCDYNFAPNRSIVLTANYPIIQQTQRYEVVSITYAPVASFSAGTPVAIANNVGKRDDVFSKALPLPFKFCFYGNTYEDIAISDNGIVSFGTTNDSGDASYAIAGQIPNLGLPKNAVFGVYHDLQNVDKVRVITQGTAPFRQFVINYDNIPQFGSSRTSTTQIVLYETTGVIEVYVKEKPENDNTTLTLQRRQALIGITNINGTEGVSPPNRNTDIWSAKEEAWRFVPSGATNISVQWYNADNGAYLGSGQSITQAPTINTRYEVRVTYDLCSPTRVTDVVQVSFSTDFPTASNIEKVYCLDSGITQTVDLTTFQTSINSDTTLTFSYHEAETQAHNNLSPISNPKAYTFTTDKIIYVRTLRSGICYAVSQIKLRTNVRPNIATPTTSFDFCDEGNDLRENINLNNIPISGVNYLHNKAFFENPTDAQANTNAIVAVSNYLLNVSLPNREKTIYVRVWNRSFDDASCAIVVPVRLHLKPYVEVKPYEAMVCYVVEGQAITHDLMQYVTNLVSGTLTYNPNDITATFYRNSSYTSVIANPSNASIIMNATIYVKLEYPNLCESRTTLKLTADTDCDGIGGGSGGGGGGIGVPALCNITFPKNINLERDYFPHYLPTGTVTSVTVIGFYDDSGMTSTITTPTNYELTEANTPKTVYVKYRINATNLETSLSFVVNASEKKTLPKDTFSICDVMNDGTERVELVPEYRKMLEDLYPSSNPSVRFFLTEVNRNLYLASNPRNETLATTFVEISGTQPHTVYALVSVEGCHYSYDLKFLLERIASPTVPLTVCDFNDDRQELVNVTQYRTKIDAELSATQRSLTTSVSYYYLESDAHKASNAIANEREAEIKTGQMSVFARVEFSEGCPVIVRLSFDFTTAVDLPTITPLNVCDISNDGTEIVNLNKAINQSNASSIVSFFNSEVGAEMNDSNFLLGVYSSTNSVTMTLTTSKTIYVRVLDLNTQCIKVLPLPIQLVSFPEITNNKVAVCDFANDSQEVISISEIKNQLVTNNPTTLNATMDFVLYLSQADALSGVASQTTVTATQNQTVWTRITPQGTDCYYVKDVVFSLIEAPKTKHLSKTICNNSSRNTSGNTSEVVNLNAYREEVIGRTLTLEDNFRFFITENDAVSNTGEIGTNYTISSFPSVVYVRTENSVTGCYSVSSITFNEYPQLAVSDTSIAFCADGQLNGIIDLTTYPAKMVSDTTVYDITYHESHTNAVNDVPITSDITNYYVIPTSVVWIKFVNRATGCYIIKRLAVSIYPSPKVNTVFQSRCDIDLSGTFTEDLSLYMSQIITGEPNVGTLYTFTYHPTLLDAQAGTNAVASPTHYQYSYADFSSHPTNSDQIRHTVFVRVVANGGIGCVAQSPIYFDALLKPTTLTKTATLTLCDDRTNQGLQSFDLTQAQNMISTQSGATFTFYRTYADAQNQTNAITNPTAYVNTNPYAETVFVRIGASGYCDDWATINLVVHPYIQAVDKELDAICEFDNKGNRITVNLLQEANAMLLTQHALQSSITTTFHNTQAEAERGSSPITANLSNYDFPAGQKIVWVRFSNQERCFVVRQLILEKIANPAVTDVEVEVCDLKWEGSFVQNLKDFENRIVTNVGSVIFRYFKNSTDARNGQNELNPLHSFTRSDFSTDASGRQIYEVVASVTSNNVNACLSVANVRFVLPDKVQITTRTTTITLCDDRTNQGLQSFDLTQAQNMISTQSGATFTFYRTYADAQNQTNAITNPTAYVNTNPYAETVFVRIGASGYCDDWATINLVVHPYIQAVDKELDAICEFDNKGNRITVNLLQEANAMLLTQHALQSSITTTFHNTQAEAERGSSPITANLSNYDFPAGQKIVWVRFSNQERCFVVRQLILEKIANPVVVDISLRFCDDDVDNIYPLDLNTLDSRVTTSNNVTVTYYQSENDARTKANPIDKVRVYNIPPHRMSYLYARVENINGCVGISKISLLTIPHLNANVSISENCENNLASSVVTVRFENKLNFANVRYAANSTDNAHSMSFDRFEGRVGYIETNQLPENTTISLTIFYEGCQYTLSESFTVTHLKPLLVTEVPQQDYALVAVEASGGRAPYQYIFNGKVYSTPTYVVLFSDPSYVDAQGRTIKQIRTVVRDALGCEVTLDIEKVFTDFHIPNFFTPDNDGNNDRWSPRNTKSYPRMITQIYDRHGRFIKMLREGESWDGTYNGSALPSGDYWYTIETNEPRDHRKFVGNFTLMR